MSTSADSSGAFRGTARDYAASRPGIPNEVVEYLRARFGLEGTGALLDMGCGTGLSTFAFAPLFERTIAFDTDPEMLAAAQARQPAGLDIEWQQRSDREVSTTEGPYRLATACRSFNWMDQYPLLDKLQRLLVPGGGVALIGDGSFWTGEEPWQATVREVIQGFLGRDRRAGGTTYSASTEPYTSMLTKSGYVHVAHEQIPVVRSWNIERIISYLYSTSFSARSLYRDRLKEFEATMRSTLLESTGGEDQFIEHARFVIQGGMRG